MKTRMNRIFKEDGRTFILAMDHGTGLEVLPALNDTGKIIKEARENGIDALICTYGIQKNFSREIGQVATIVRVDGGPTMIGPAGLYTKDLLEVKEALRLGAEGVVCMGFPGSPDEDNSMKQLENFIAQGEEWNVPVCAEMLPMGWDSSEWTPERLTFVSRVGAEYGADIVKTQYTGDKESFKKLVDGCYVPVVILGGPGGGAERELLTAIRDSLDVGGSGVAIGRSIWKHENPGAYCRAIAKVVHEDASVDEAMKEFE